MDMPLALGLIAAALVIGFVFGRRAPGGTPLPPPASPDQAALAAVRPILASDGMIAAIKAYRERTGAGLRDAKLAVETL